MENNIFDKIYYSLNIHILLKHNLYIQAGLVVREFACAVSTICGEYFVSCVSVRIFSRLFSVFAYKLRQLIEYFTNFVYFASISIRKVVFYGEQPY